MLRLTLSALVLSLLAACAGAPQKTSRPSSSGMSITTPRAYAPPRGFPNFVDHSVGREEISIQAMSLVGVPYRWGGNTPESGFDCSGLVRYVVDRAANVSLPRTTADMSAVGDSIEPDGIAPGDLIFFNTSGRPHSHVGIYVGKLRFVNAPSTGGTVRLDYLTNPYWAKRFDGIRRVASAKAKPVPFDAPTYQAGRQPDVTQRAGPAAAPAAYAANTNAPVRSRSAAANEAPPVFAATNAAAPTNARAAAPAYAANAAAPARPAATGAPAYVANQPDAAPPARLAGAATAAASADPYEPPPSAMSAAQQQARAAGAIDAAAASVDPDDAPSRAYAPAAGSATITAVRPSAPADPIDAADAFEPPPPTARAAARQARLAAPGNVQVLRASTAAEPSGAAAPGTHDDPIARFANGSY
ncbi:hydrolase Nlp/P60 [Burkholderia singularis]|uniref:Hydrolase Nlp/P60 n=1 Tax=Burkholderia singularis TaxID=1503053 RepID=A0A103E103_9BURK|nr:C40 family peptidase [Burkholderia singularis]KVE26414.1 hydrolase Nlp/P60 [Burkholderia singularis]